MLVTLICILSFEFVYMISKGCIASPSKNMLIRIPTAKA